MERIKSNKTGQLWGYIDRDVKLFYKSVDPKQHKMYKYNSYGIQKSILDKIKGYTIIIAERYGGKIYHTTATEWIATGIEEKSPIH